MAEQMKEAIQSLCCSHGWAYGLVWRIRSRDSMMLMPEDVYHEEEVGMVIERMLHQVHVVGEGIIGQVAFSGKHRWIFSETRCGDPVSLSDNQDGFQDPAEWDHQFSAGIKTIALIPLSSQNVLQFGSHQKICENLEFVDDTRSLFRKLESSPESFLSGSVRKDNGSSIEPSKAMPSGAFMPGSSLAKLQLNGFSQESSSSPTNSSSPTASRSAWGCGAPSLASVEPQLLLKMRRHGSANVMSPTCSNAVHPCQKTLPSTQGYSDTTSGSVETGVEFDSPVYGAGIGTGTQHLALLFSSNEVPVLSENLYATGPPFGPHTPRGPASFQMVQGGFEPLNASLCRPNSTAVNMTSQWMNNSLLPQPDDDLLRALGVPSFAPGMAGRDVIGDPIGRGIQLSTLRRTASSVDVIGDGKDGPMNAPAWLSSGDDLFDGLGDIVSPESSGHSSNLNISPSDSSNLDVGSNPGSRKGFFAEFGLGQLLSVGVGGVNTATSLRDNRSSILTLPRASSTSGFNNQVRLSDPSFLSRSMNSLLPQNTGTTAQVPPRDVHSASLVSSWINGGNNVTGESSNTVQPKKSEDPAKVPRKRARPGESTRPRPKDRQQIQDRVKELRELVPSGAKCSIDSLLDRTIKYMLFLQSVIKYADTFKQEDVPKMIDRGNGFVLKDSSDNGEGFTWAFEIGGTTMVCPIMVEDIKPTGQMLVELQMLCEEHGLFLEIADIIRGFGLIILKGVMETRDDKIWARFVVEANRKVTRTEIFLSLIQLLQQTSTGIVTSASEPPNMSGPGVPGMANYQQSPVPFH